MTDTVTTFLRVLMLALAAFLPLINPPGSAPLFLSLTPGASDPVRTVLARRVAWHSFVVLVTAVLVGSYVLIFFGLSLPVVKIAGGLLVVATAWQLIGAEHTADASLVAPSGPVPPLVPGHSFYPLTFPLTIGPGSISVAVTLGAGLRHDAGEFASTLGMILGLAVVAIAIYLCYRFASRLARVLGATGTVVLLRMSAFILLCVGVKILCDGVAERFAV